MILSYWSFGYLRWISGNNNSLVCNMWKVDTHPTSASDFFYCKIIQSVVFWNFQNRQKSIWLLFCTKPQFFFSNKLKACFSNLILALNSRRWQNPSAVCSNPVIHASRNDVTLFFNRKNTSTSWKMVVTMVFWTYNFEFFAVVQSSNYSFKYE
jgi:hypothetical protein